MLCWQREKEARRDETVERSTQCVREGKADEMDAVKSKEISEWWD